MLCHISCDINQGALPAILPFLVLQANLSYTQTGSLLLFASIVSSVVQPLLGYMGDKSSRPWIMGVGILLAGGGIAAIGICETYLEYCVAAGVSGFGAALFHPEGGKIANYASGSKKGVGLSIFAVGGNIGFMLGPIVASSAIVLFGLIGATIFLAPAVIMFVVILFVKW